MDRHQEAADLLLSARRDRSQRLNALPDLLQPKTLEQAYLIQRAVMEQRGTIGGWKVGRAGPDSFTCAPLPASTVVPSPADAADSDCAVEAEIAVTLAHDLPLRETPYTEADLRAAIASAHPAIEVLSTRFTDPDKVDKLSVLADSLANHSLVVGPSIPDWASIDLTQEDVAVLVDGKEVKRGRGNPAGDMFVLLVWLANTGTRWAGGLKAGQVVTTGSWTGKDVAQPGAEARIRFAHCGEAAVRFVP